MMTDVNLTGGCKNTISSELVVIWKVNEVKM